VNAYYWLLVWADGTAGDVVVYYDGGGVGLYKSASFGDWQTTLTGYTFTTNKFSIYGTYESFSSANFGYETEGTAGTTQFSNYITGSLFTITEDGTADSITAYIKGAASLKLWKAAIYLHSDSSLVGAIDEGSFQGETLHWETLTFSEPKPSLTASTGYVLVVWSESTIQRVAYDVGDADQGHRTGWDTYDGNYPNPASFTTHSTDKYSIYCTYTTVGGEAYTADLTQSLSTAWTVLTQWSATVPLTQSLTSTWQTALEWDAITDLSRTFSTSWLVDIIHTAGAIAHIVDLTQAFATTWNILTSWNAIIDLTQAFGTSWQILTQTDFLTALTQTFTSSWIVDVIHTIGANQYYVDLTQAIATTWTILTQWNGIIDLTQSFGTTWTVLIETDFITALTQAFTTSWIVEAVVGAWQAFNVDLTLNIVTSWIVEVAYTPWTEIYATKGFVLATIMLLLLIGLPILGIIIWKKRQ